MKKNFNSSVLKKDKLYFFSAIVDSKEIWKGSIYAKDENAASFFAKCATRFELCELRARHIDDIQIVFSNSFYTIKN